VSGSPTKLLEIGSGIRTARLSPSGDYIAAVGVRDDGKHILYVWNRKGAQLMPPAQVPTPASRIPALAWRSDGKELAVAAGSEVWLFHPVKGSKTVLQAAPSVRALQYEGDSLMARTDQTTFVWHAHSHVVRWRLSQQHLLQATLSPDGLILATSCFQDGVRIFDIKRRKLLDHLEAGSIATGLKFSEKGNYLTCGYRNPGGRHQDRIKTYDMKKKKQFGPTLSTPALRGFDGCADGSKIVARTEEKATVWSTSDGRVLGESEQGGRLVDRLSPNGKWVVSAPEDGRSALLWRAQKAKKQHHLELSGAVQDLSFGRTGELLIAAGSATLWKAP